MAACAIVTALCGGLLADARAAFLSVAVFLSGFYFAIVVLRAILIVFLDLTGLGNRRPRPTRPCAPENHPVYSVLVALKGEAGQVGTLVEALDRLDWPVTKREIFLICEEDDPDTIAAIRRLDLPEGSRVHGPAILEQGDATVVVDPDLVARTDRFGNLIIERE